MPRQRCVHPHASKTRCKICCAANSARYYRKADRRSALKERRWKQYGIRLTMPQYKALLQAQHDCCALCREPFEDSIPIPDHDHRTGQVRGLVHHRCNLLIGLAHDDDQFLQLAVEYLQETRRGKMIRWLRDNEEIISKKHLALLETELRYYRERFEGERARGDRANDALLQSRGVLPVSDLGIEKMSEAEERAAESMKIMQDQLAEIYGDGVESQEPGLPAEEEEKS